VSVTVAGQHSPGDDSEYYLEICGHLEKLWDHVLKVVAFFFNFELTLLEICACLSEPARTRQKLHTQFEN
jgi:hypothetical protein